MAVYINTNLSALNARRHLESSGKDLNLSMERLSSGKRVNRASDDAAGLVISNRLTTQVRGLSQAIRNANDGISLIQTAEGALSESSNILQRMRELSVQSANGIYSDTDRATLDSEVQQLVAELDRIAETTTFNDRNILDGSLGDVDLQVGANSEQTIAMNIQAMDASRLGLGSVSGDFVGSNMVLSGDGTLANAINDGDVLINGQSFGRIDAGTSIEDLLDKINSDVNGVKVSTYVELEAASVGDGILGEDDTVTITITNTNATTLSVEISNTNSLAELADKITANSGGLLSGTLDSDGKLVVTGTNVANVSISDDTGTATGLTGGTSNSGSVYQSIIDNLNNTWLRESEILIRDYFGIEAPDGTGIDLIFAETDGSFTGDTSGVPAGVLAGQVSDGAGGGIAAVYNDPSNLKLFVDMADFTSAEGSYPLFNDRVIAHEMVHAVMAADIPSGTNNALPGWFSEGIAEFIHGADERVLGDINDFGPGQDYTDGINNILAEFGNALAPGSPSTSAGYSAGYLAVRVLHEEIIANGGTGISEVFTDLQTTDLNTAISNRGIDWNGGGTTLAEFENYFQNIAGYAYIEDGYLGSNNYAAVSVANVSSKLDLNDTDTGSIAGSDYSGGVLTASSVLSGNVSGTSLRFDLGLPSGFSASASGASARLVIESEHGDPVTVTRGTSGRLSDLKFLGFQEISDAGVIRGASISDPSTAWTPGEISINGVDVDVSDTNSFQGKLDAINAIADQTGVTARAFASAMLIMENFDYTTWSTTNWGDFGINGVTITGIGTDATAEDMVDTINGFSDQTGVKAIVNGSNIILEANRAITIHDTDAATGPDAAIAFGASNGGNARILNSAEDTSNGSDEAVTDGTQVQTGIELVSGSGSAIQLETGDISFSQTGWLDANTTSEGGGFGAALNSISVATQANAQTAIGVIDNALETINDTRSQLGAVNNRLDFTLSSLANILENSIAARSRILDADFAAETARLSAAQIMQQASSAMLAQANARPQNVLSLLQ